MNNLLREKGMLYDIGMSILALGTIAILLIQEKVPSPYSNILGIIDNMIWGVFVIDYVVRFVTAEDKWRYVKSNVVELIAILPFDAMLKSLRALRLIRVARASRLFRVFRSLRAFAYLNRLNNRISDLLQTNQFHSVLWFTFSTIFLGAIAISYVEGMPFEDALWWSFVTTTTVGYGDISPASFPGRLIAVVLMMVGIGFIGLLTGTIATYFLKPKRTSFRSDTIGSIIAKLEDFDNLTDEEVSDICSTIQGLRGSKKAPTYQQKRQEGTVCCTEAPNNGRNSQLTKGSMR